MGLPEADKKEALGQAYVRAVIAKAGFNFAKSEKDFGLDGTIKDIAITNGRYHENGFGIEFQLKSSSDVVFDNGEIVYDLESKNYNDLAGWEGTWPGILILFVMPTEEKEWISQTVNSLEIKRCAWWCSLEGQPLTDNTATKRIRIAEGNVFSPEALEALMQKVREGKRL